MRRCANDGRAIKEGAVTCHLLQRLKRQTDASGARSMLYLQYGGLEIVDGGRRAIPRSLLRLPTARK